MTTFDTQAENSARSSVKKESAAQQASDPIPETANNIQQKLILRPQDIARGSGRPLAAVVAHVEDAPAAKDEDGADQRPQFDTLGKRLQATREAQGKTVEQAARATLISERQVMALEAGHWHLLPEPVYVTGTLKRYATWLGIDPVKTIADYRAEAAPTGPDFFKFPERVNKESSGFARFAMAASLLLMAGVGYGVWSVTTDNARNWTETTPPVPDRLATLVEQLPEERMARSGGVDEANAAIAPEMTLPRTMTIAPIPSAQVIQPLPLNDFETATDTRTSADTLAARVILRAREDSWIQIEGDDAELIVTRVLRAGEEYAIPARDDLVMITGNAGGIEILLDGQSMGVLGKRGDVRRDVSLSADAISGELTQPNQ